MNTNALRKSKWYMFAVIIALLILSIGLSFCVWDTKSFKTAISGNVGEYKANYIVAQDINKNQVADIGDTVYFGNYYQQANETTKTPLEWRVVDIRQQDGNNVLYLLSEKAVASGSMNGYHWYFTTDNEWGSTPGGQVDPCYDNSTLRAWLNSDQGEGGGRVDGGIGFSDPPAGSGKVFNGFYNEAFNSVEKDTIVARDIPGMYGLSFLANGNASPVQYNGVKNQKVWVPSQTEVTGENLSKGDSSSDRQFKYFADRLTIDRVAFPTDYNKLIDGEVVANYAKPNLPNCANNLGQPNKQYFSDEVDGAVIWWTRSSIQPSATLMCIGRNGTILNAGSDNSTVSVRPAICLQQ